MRTGREWLERWFSEVWSDPWSEATIDEMMAPDVRMNGFSPEGTLDRDGFRKVWRHFRERYKDLKIEVLHASEGEDFVAAYCQATATHGACGAPLKFNGTLIAKTRDGKAVETFETWDFASMFAQIGEIGEECISAEMPAL